MARLVFIGRLEDLAGAAERELRIDGTVGYDALLALLDPALAGEVQRPKVRLALNGLLVTREALALTDDDELAFLPPVSGG